MPKDFPRARRIADQIQRELADIIRFELKDPRIGMITLTDVEVSQDYAHARVFFTVLADAQQTDETREALQHASGFLRSQLARRAHETAHGSTIAIQVRRLRRAWRAALPPDRRGGGE